MPRVVLASFDIALDPSVEQYQVGGAIPGRLHEVYYVGSVSPSWSLIGYAGWYFNVGGGSLLVESVVSVLALPGLSTRSYIPGQGIPRNILDNPSPVGVWFNRVPWLTSGVIEFAVYDDQTDPAWSRR